MSETKASCGPQTVMVNTDTLRLAKCPCGTFHVTLVASGVTVQLSEARLAELGRAIGIALPPSGVSPAGPRSLGTRPAN
jgi:hypothetical protein